MCSRMAQHGRMLIIFLVGRRVFCSQSLMVVTTAHLFFLADDQFCEDFLTCKDLPKVGSSCGTLESNLAKIQAVQPPPLDMSTITDEVIGGVMTLSRGEGTRG